MRMRRKRHLEERLENTGIYYTEIRESEMDTRKAESAPIDLHELFGRSAPIELEIGCGKGAFAIELAKRHPEYNILAIEKCKNVLLTACQNAAAEKIPNLRFICTGAEYLDRHLPENSVSRIYLNFSCPYPKGRYANRRLTAPQFLNIYRSLLMPDGEIHQKTDHQHFFEFSIEQLSKAGWTLKNISLDLHSSDFEGNIMTEYEKNFVSKGLPIYRLEAYIQ